MSCSKCHQSDKEKKIVCDRLIHVVCAGLNVQELKVLILKDGKRTLRYSCDDCQERVRLVPKLLKKIDILEEKLYHLLSTPTGFEISLRTCRNTKTFLQYFNFRHIRIE